MKKQNILILLILLTATLCIAQNGGMPLLGKRAGTKHLQWAKRAGGTGGDRVKSVLTLSDGSVIISGQFDATATFGLGEVNETILNTAGLRDIFIAKYNADGTLAWAKRAGGTGNDFGLSISKISNSNILLVGIFENTATFGLGEVNETTLISAGGRDIFIAKYNADGTLAWVKQAGGTSTDQGSSISALSDDSSLVVGVFQGTAIFGAGEVNETQLISVGGLDLFFAKYNANGTLAWVKQAGGTGHDQSPTISALPGGSAVVAGIFENTATFGLGETNETQLISAGLNDLFIAKYNSDGTLAWAKRAGGTEYDHTWDMMTWADGSSLVAGHCMGTATFGLGEVNETTLISAGNKDAIIAKYNADGTLAWVKQAGATLGDRSQGAATLADGSALIVGMFQEAVVFGQGEANETLLTSAGLQDIFIAKYNADGTLVWAKRAGGTDTLDQASSVSVLSDGSFFVGGTFSGKATFGPGEINETLLTSAGSADIFIAKYQATTTAIELLSFTATKENRDIILEWKTASEIDCAGFYLWRSNSKTGKYSKITEYLIPTQGGATWGAKYSYKDFIMNSDQTYYYKLQDVDNKGRSTFHGPVSATSVKK